MRMPIPFLSRPPRVSLIRLTGTIGAGGRFGQGLNDAALAPLIGRAFRAGRPSAVAVVINSPGGSAVQSSLIGARLRRLADERKLPLHAFVEDVAASGGYWLAAAADDIWIDAASVVGSIGVISASFGVSDLLARQGIERRVHTAGQSKSLADPFLPQRPEDIARLRAILEPIHASFIAHVRARRGERLSDDPGLFEGEVWVGAEAVARGLADGIDHPVPRLRALYGEKVQIQPLGQRQPLLRRLGLGRSALQAVAASTVAAEHGAAAENLADAAAAAISRRVLAEVEAHALWGRYGL